VGRAQWTLRKNCSMHSTGSCTKTFPILSASTVPGRKPCYNLRTNTRTVNSFASSLTSDNAPPVLTN